MFLACGAWGQPRLGLADEKLLGSGLEFLTAVKEGLRERPGERVVVIGGGNVAVDVALTAKRLGAADVTMVCLECAEEMPALSWEVEQARAEGVKVYPSWGPARILAEDGRLTGLELVRCTCVFDEACAFNPAFDQAVRETPGRGPGVPGHRAARLPRLSLTRSDALRAGQRLYSRRHGHPGHGAPGRLCRRRRGQRARPRSSPPWRPAGGGGEAIGADLRPVAAAEPAPAAAPLQDLQQPPSWSPRPARQVPESPWRCGTSRPEDASACPLQQVEREAIVASTAAAWPSLPSDLAPALVALGAGIKTTRRVLAPEDFFAGSHPRVHGIGGGRVGGGDPASPLPASGTCSPTRSSASATPSTSPS